ncbi:hypothetical protein [Armatimonas sp.]|uniref:hypothetical protein n=1 Tax=Armatimonas sp. TaxID=1872638 RepID=UPI00375032FE
MAPLVVTLAPRLAGDTGCVIFKEGFNVATGFDALKDGFLDFFVLEVKPSDFTVFDDDTLDTAKLCAVIFGVLSQPY